MVNKSLKDTIAYYNKKMGIAKIYMLWSPHGDKVYIGKTFMGLGRRLSSHRSKYYNQRKQTQMGSTTMFHLYGEDVRIKLLEDFEDIYCTCALGVKERQYIRKYGRRCTNIQSNPFHNKNKEGISFF